MSRCFPFPPPGYERKTKLDGTDLLKKEKHREKKHKKEKKDKEKKEGKEKREKERSDDKHREKKDKKEKYRDKKKDKERGRDKDKLKSDLLLSDEKVVGSADSHLHKFSEKSKEREIDKNAFSAEKRSGGLSAVHNGMPVSKSNHQVSETKSLKCAQDLGRKNVDEERSTFNHLPDNNIGAERKDGVVNLVAKSGGPLQDSTERKKEKPALDGRVDGRGAIGDARSSGGIAPNSIGVQIRAGGIPTPVEKKIEHRLDWKEKVREKEGNDRKGDRRKEKDREKPVPKDKEKEKKKEEVVKATTEEKLLQVTRMKDGNENHMLNPSAKDGTTQDFSGVQSVGSHNMTKHSNRHAATVNNNLKKRKNIGLNGIYDELVTGPNKLARTTASPHLLAENGRSLEPCQNSAAFVPGTQRPPVNKMECDFSHSDIQKPSTKIKVVGKECKINGTVAEPCTQSSRETSAISERKFDAPAKPHPDIKYLSQVLLVPKVDEWSDFDEQEWLFNSNSSLTRKPEEKLSGIDEMIDDTPQVWARALWLEPVDAYALPYVIPH